VPLCRVPSGTLFSQTEVGNNRQGLQVVTISRHDVLSHRKTSLRVKRNFFWQQEMFRLTRGEGVWQSSRPFADVGSLTTE
jgi:hypothetical protein